VWSEYLGDTIYGDFTVEPYQQDPELTVTVERTYLSPWAHMEAGGFEPVYYHPDHLGTTRLLSQQAQGGYNVLAHTYTGFGEADTVPASPAPDAATRYGYVGAHGYESGLLTFTGGQGSFPMTLQHVGERWYDPATGRFLQRDPIGLRAGPNVYLYSSASPLVRIDSAGLINDGAQTWPYHYPPYPPPPPQPPRDPLTPQGLPMSVDCTETVVGVAGFAAAGWTGVIGGGLYAIGYIIIDNTDWYDRAWSSHFKGDSYCPSNQKLIDYYRKYGQLPPSALPRE
jgi:RHS repeat-associated protein